MPAAYAIIEDRGSQMKVAAGDILDIDVRPEADDQGKKSKSKSKKAEKLTFDRVLLIGDAESDKPASVGAPYVAGATVEAEIVDEVRGEKLDVIMYKRRKGQRRKIGHRQNYLRIKITKINA